MMFKLFPSDNCRNCGHSRICHVIVEDQTAGTRTQRCYPSLGMVLKFMAPSCSCTEYLEPLKGNENGKSESESANSE